MFSYLRSFGIIWFDDSLKLKQRQITCRSPDKHYKRVGISCEFWHIYDLSCTKNSIFRFYNRLREVQVCFNRLENWNNLQSSNDTTEKDHVSIKQHTALIGLFNSASTAVQLGPLHHRYLDRDKRSAMETSK